MDYKALARAYHAAVSAYDRVAVTNMVREDYIQHNPRLATGRAAFVEYLPKLEENETKIVNVRMLNDGPFVVMHHVWKNAFPFGGDEVAAFHVIRIDEGGLIAEHWSVMAVLNGVNPSGRSAIDGETALDAAHNGLENKAHVSTLLHAWIAASPDAMADASENFFWPDYHQHHRHIGDGIGGFKAACKVMSLDYQRSHRVFGEANFVLSVAEGRVDGAHTALYDLFRLDGGLIAEHWSINQTIPSQGWANANTMFNFHLY